MLVAILVDHIPGNVLEFLTPRNFGLSDSSEAFVFLSGLSVGMVYIPRARKHGLGAVARGCLKRALKLYGVHIALTLAALAIFAAAYQMSGVETLIEAHGRSYVFSTPASGLAGLALLSHQLGYFNILPLYVVLMLWSPVALALTLHNPRLALLVSLCIYAAARALGLHLPNWPEPGGWFFNPLTWQLVFTAGLFSAVVWRDAPPRPSPGLVAVSVATIVAAAMVATSAGGVSPRLSRGRDGAPRYSQARSGIGAARPFLRARLSRGRHAQSGQSRRGAVRPRGAEPRPQQPGGVRLRLAVERRRSSHARRRLAAHLGRG